MMFHSLWSDNLLCGLLSRAAGHLHKECMYSKNNMIMKLFTAIKDKIIVHGRFGIEIKIINRSYDIIMVGVN